jgi:Tat protein translocase TatB subunit
MPSIGPLEIMAVAVLALIVFGPQRLPEIARNIGKAINELRRMSTEMTNELREGMSVDDDEDEPPEPAKPGVGRGDPDEQER